MLLSFFVYQTVAGLLRKRVRLRWKPLKRIRVPGRSELREAVVQGIACLRTAESP